MQALLTDIELLHVAVDATDTALPIEALEAVDRLDPNLTKEAKLTELAMLM